MGQHHIQGGVVILLSAPCFKTELNQMSIATHMWAFRLYVLFICWLVFLLCYSSAYCGFCLVSWPNNNTRTSKDIRGGERNSWLRCRVQQAWLVSQGRRRCNERTKGSDSRQLRTSNNRSHDLRLWSIRLPTQWSRKIHIHSRNRR